MGFGTRYNLHRHLILKTVIFSILILVFANVSNCKESNVVHLDRSIDNTISQKVFQMLYNSRLLVNGLKSLVNEKNNEYSKAISPNCHNALNILLNKPIEHRWAISMLDSNAPFPTGLLSDSLTSLGEYQQCLSIEGVLPDQLLTGQYCLLQIKFIAQSKSNQTIIDNHPMQLLLRNIQQLNHRYPLTLGICIPSSCPADQIDFLIQKYLEQQLSGSESFRLNIQYCQNVQDESFIAKRRTRKSAESLFELVIEKNLSITLPILVAVILMVIVGTTVDVITDSSSRPNSVSTILICFSFFRNTRILFADYDKTERSPISDKTVSIESRFSYLHGMRTLFIIWIIVAHSCSLIPASINMPFSFMARYPHDIVQMNQQNSIMSNFLSNGTLVVEAFFLISGLLLTAIIIEKQLYHKVNFVQFVMIRWIRFAIPLLGTIVFNKCIVLLGNGPLFRQSMIESSFLNACNDQHWWKGFLFIQNWFNLSDTCIPISWFVSADLQIHIIAFGLIWLFRRRMNRMVKVYCIAMISLSMTIPLVLLLTKQAKTFSNMDIFASLTGVSIPDYIRLYSGTHMHMGAYFFGSIIGFYLVTKGKGSSFIQNQQIQQILWWTSVSLVVTIPFLNIQTSDTAPLSKAITIGTYHAVWLLSLGTIFYQLANVEQNANSNSTNSVSSFLSSTCFKSVGRLSFSMYLIHMTVIWFNLYSLKSPFDISTSRMVLFCFGILGETMAGAYLLFILFECPTINLMKYFAKPPASKGLKSPPI